MLPAYAGMIRAPDVRVRGPMGAPRVCGDDPPAFPLGNWTETCSPRMRG